jgi:hypothetical protein
VSDRIKHLLVPRSRRGRVGRLLVVILLAFLGSVAFAPAASAADCKQGPIPESPADGAAGSLLPQRNGLSTGAQATRFEQYGFAGLNWESYDVGVAVPTVGCIPNADAIDASTADSIANIIFGAANGIAAFADSIMRSAYDVTWMRIFDPFMQSAINALRTNVFSVFAPLGVAVVGLWVLWKARKASLKSTAALVGGGLIVMLGVTAVLSWPLYAAHFVDETTTQAVSTVSGAINGTTAVDDPNATKRTADQALMNGIYDHVLYRTWLAGELGNPDSATAKKYGADLFAAQAFTWDEAAKAAAAGPVKLCDDPAEITNQIPCPGTPASMSQEKQKQFVEIANKIQAEDPAAYANLQGTNGRERIWYALLALAAVLLSLPVVVIGSLAMVSCFLVTRFALILLPIVAPAAIVKPSIAMDVWDRVASIAITAFVWGIGIPIAMTLNAAVFQANLPPAIQLLLLFVLAVVTLATLWGFSPGFSGAVRKHGKKGRGLASDLLGKLATGVVIGSVAGRAARQPTDGGDDVADADPDGTYSHSYDPVRKGNRPAPDPQALPAGRPAETVDAEIIPDKAVDDDIIDVDEVPAGRELPPAIYEPTHVATAADIDADVAERGLPSEPDPAEVGRLGDDAAGPVDPSWDEDDSRDVYHVYSGDADWVEPGDLRSEDTYMGEGGDVSDRDLPALPAASSGGEE